MKEQILKQTKTNTEEQTNGDGLETRKAKKENMSNDESTMYRVVITKDANLALEEIVSKVNVGFDAGTITKSDVAIFVFQNMSRFFSDTDTKTLRSLHFDDKKVLSSILKGDSDLPEEIKKAIRSHYGVSEKDKKKSPKHLSDLSTEAPVDKS